jgi:hypothetical protein
LILTITIARKPVEGTVAQNVLMYEVGGLNIDKCRIFTDWIADRGEKWLKGGNSRQGYLSNGVIYRERDYANRKDLASRVSTLGRFPANLILSHLPGCVQIGTKTTPGYAINRFKDGAKPFGGGAGHVYESEKKPDEETPVWDCVEGCPVGDLTERNGEKVSGGLNINEGFGER